MVIYGDEQSGYPHPDHLRVHDVGIVAFRAAGDPERFPESGDPWQPTKLYYTTFSVARFREIHLKFIELGLESPFDETWRERWEGMTEAPITTQVDVSAYGHIRREALLAHATQVDPTSRFWFGLPPEVMDGIHPRDDYQLAEEASVTGNGVSIADVDPDSMKGPAGLETDLFAGIRTAAANSVAK
jgi:mycothiol S-conjugate amidase